MSVLLNPRSALHALKPLGLGTSDVESLLSYMCRLAVSHSTSTLSLTRNIALQVKHEISTNFDWHARQISGIRESAEMWSAALSALTTVGRLDELTFLPWRNVISQNGLPMVSRGQFCAACFAEDLAAGKTPYFRLAWELETVSVCHRHATQLQRVCSQCGRDNIRHAAAFVVPGWCTRCGSFLGQAAAVQESAPCASPAALWQARQVSELLRTQQGLGTMPNRSVMLAALAHIITEMDGGNSAAFARRIGVGKGSVHHWLKGPGTPTLAISMQIAVHCGIALPNLLAGNIESWVPPEPVDQMALKLLSSVREVRAASRDIDWTEIEAQLQVFLHQPAPISVLEAARRLNVEARQLYLRANRTTRMIGERWKIYIRRRQEAAVVKAWPALEVACRDILAQGRAVTMREIRLVVPAEVLSTVPRLIDVLKDVQAHMFTT